MKFKKKISPVGHSSYIIIPKFVRDTEKIKNGEEVWVTIEKIGDDQ